jgi:hypothetical protein
MKKEEIIERYGEAAYETVLERQRAYNRAHKEEANARGKKYREEHPEQVRANNNEIGRRGGKYYDKTLEYKKTGITGEKNRIRMKHVRRYKPYKAIIAPESQIHHEWVPNTSEYRGVALVEKDQHQYGIVDVIEILDGKITLLTEEEVKKGKRKKN